MKPATKRILVLGGGFGGVYTVLNLARFLTPRQKRQTQILLVSNRNYFLFTPLLHEVTTGGVGHENLIFPLRELAGSHIHDFYQQSVQAIDFEKKTVRTNLTELPYDYLVVALGSRACTFAVPGAEECAFILKTLNDAARLRNHFIHALELATKEKDPTRRRELLTFVVVGGGALGTELAPEIGEMLRDWAPLYPQISPREISVHLVHSGKRLVEQFGPLFHAHALKVMKKHQIKLHFESRVTRITLEEVVLSTGETIRASTAVWSAGIEPVELGVLPAEACLRGRLIVEPTLQIKGYPAAFALGDMALFTNQSGQALPATAQVAEQQARIVAQNIAALLKGRSLEPFVYRHKGFALSLGQWEALVDFPALKMTGLPGWLVYRLMYFFLLVGAENKFKVLLDWFLDLFFPRRSSEL